MTRTDKIEAEHGGQTASVTTTEGATLPDPGAREWLIRKGAYFYRPNSQGYTSSPFVAGRYTLADAVAITHPNGPDGPRDDMSFVHMDDVPILRTDKVAELVRKLAIATDALTKAAYGTGQTRGSLRHEARKALAEIGPVPEWMK